MTCKTLIASVSVLLGCAASTAAQSVSLQFDSGRVTLTAQDAPIRTILAEWQRVGGTRIVNGDRVTGPPVTLELKGVSERQALETLLRSAAGYVVTPRATGQGASVFGGVVILATSTPPRGVPGPTFTSTPVQPPRPQAVLDDNDPDPDDRPVGPVRVNPFVPPQAQIPPNGGPIVVRPGAPVLPPGQEIPQTQPQRTTTPTTMPGTSRPGEVTPAPQRPQNQR